MEKNSMIFNELPVVISFVMLLETPFKLWYDNKHVRLSIRQENQKYKRKI